MNTPHTRNTPNTQHAFLRTFTRSCAVTVAALCGLVLGTAHAAVALPDQPVFTNTGVPGNLALALSVEFPTAVSVAHIDAAYSAANVYLGYFDPNKCYRYVYVADEKLRHFAPRGDASSRKCDDRKWSGNFLNWATMQTIDPFRWALTGGYRSVDTPTLTLLEKAWASGQGGAGNFPNKALGTETLVKDNTSLGWTSLTMRIQGLGNKMRFTRTGDVDGGGAVVPYNPGEEVSSSTVYEVSVRVKVCDTGEGAGTLEANCTAYPSGAYKPTGLLQQYAEKIRYSAFGYLNDDDINRDGGVLRAQQKFVGPLAPRPNNTALSNAASEWDANNGVMVTNPDASDASDTATLLGVPVSNSGVMNYLNKFGQIPPPGQTTPVGFKTYDPVGELYYAAIRYFKNQGNVPEWTDMTGRDLTARGRQVDGFPVITNWGDPIQYSCQRNFILGIGDVNTHADKNVPGPTSSATEPTKPATVLADTSVDSVEATNKVGQLHGLGAGLGNVLNYNGCCSNNSALMAGLAYDAHTKDIRPDEASKPNTKGLQTISTYWLDILEYRTYKADNQYYLAAKYGGFKVPEGFDPVARATDIPREWWSTSGENTASGQARPDNYFVASQPDQMVNGLKRAFASIASQLRSFSTSFSTASPQVAASGTNSFSAQYDSSTWTGEVTANAVTFGSDGSPILSPTWSFSGKLAAQIASDDGKGWDTKRVIATYKTGDNVGVAFRLSELSGDQQSALDTVFRSGNDASDYLKYLRGDATHEESSTAAGSSKAYRNRVRPLGDIVGSRLRVVGPPSAPLASAANPGYAEFKNRDGIRDRTPMVYVGSNDGMLHAINAGSNATTAGTEVFAYVPGSLYRGPTGTPNVNGLQTRGDPDFTHRYFVDGTPATFDIDFGRTEGSSTGTSWRTILVGSLGKGGKSYYAIDVTNPAAMTSEAAVASKVLWEFSDAKLGYTFGEPIAVKTVKYGWVLVFGSGYNNNDGRGYIFIVNPRTGALLEPPIATGAATTDEAGLAHVQAYVPDRTDGTAETLYAGDLLGNLWRVDVTGTSGNYPTATLFASLTNKLGQALPVTSRPLVVIQPYSNRRWVVVGTGRLLSDSDKASSQSQGFFAFMDGNLLRTNSSAQLPSGISFPLQRSNLRELTDLTTRVTLDLSSEIGWWFDLGASAGLGWRVLQDPSSFYGQVSFATMLPSIADACSPSGLGRIYTIDLGTGQSKLITATGTPLAYFDGFTGSVTDLRNLSVGGKRRLNFGTDNGGIGSAGTAPETPLPARRMNWRELLLAD
jgi:type IV pilus assembly protein PilY1